MSNASTVQLQDLIDRMNAGDGGARDLLIGHACARLQKVARKIRQDFPRIRNNEETGDVLQKGIVRLLRALPVAKVATVKEFFRLAAVQVRRELLDMARRPGRVKNASDLEGDALEKPQDTTHEPIRLAVWTEFHGKVEALPEQEREVVDLLWYQGMSQAEAAAVLQVSVPTVKRRWLSARLRLQATLGDLDLGEEPE
jgi:RNA polymerase sigma-70 factor (ECF subfamily)